MSNRKDKTWMGVIFAIVLPGLLGLLIGLCIYNNGYEKSTFLKGWGKTVLSFIILIFILIFIFVIFGY